MSPSENFQPILVGLCNVLFLSRRVYGNPEPPVPVQAIRKGLDSFPAILTPNIL